LGFAGSPQPVSSVFRKDSHLEAHFITFFPIADCELPFSLFVVPGPLGMKVYPIIWPIIQPGMIKSFFHFSLPVVLAVVFTLSILTTVSATTQRKALVIGNGSYAIAPLRNPVNDAAGMAEVLKKNGFQVVLLKNAGYRKMKEAIQTFGRNLQKGDAGLFYFAGHGIQYNGRNYLIPVDAEIKDEADVEYEALDASRVLSKMELAGNDVNIVILDACRSNPFARSFRSAERGLRHMNAPAGSLVAYSTAPGQLSADGNGKHGIYTGYLLKYMDKPGLTIEQVFKHVRKEVRRETSNNQIPWENSSLTGSFYFAGAQKIQPKKVKPAAKPATGSIVITTRPDRAKIWIDEGYEGLSPLDISALAPGLIVVKAGKKGYISQQEKVRIRAGRKSQLVLLLEQKKVPAGRLYIQAIPVKSRITFEDSSIQYRHGVSLTAGKYRIEVSHPGYETVQQQLEIISGRELRTTVRLAKIKKKQPPKTEDVRPLTTVGTVPEKPSTSRLTILTNPWNARVRILNINPVYHPGMELAPGRYHLEVSHSAYQTLYKWIELPASDKTFSISLQPLQINKPDPGKQEQPVRRDKGQELARLTIVPDPWNARVQILNIQPAYRPGMKLPAGRYHIEVSSKGYQTVYKWLELRAGESHNTVFKLIPQAGNPLKQIQKQEQPAIAGIWREVTSHKNLVISKRDKLTVTIRNRKASNIQWHEKSLTFNEKIGHMINFYKLKQTDDQTLVGWSMSQGKKYLLLFKKQ
jgi:hypothetical protein